MCVYCVCTVCVFTHVEHSLTEVFCAHCLHDSGRAALLPYRSSSHSSATLQVLTSRVGRTI
jgi:hypothetical protein